MLLSKDSKLGMWLIVAILVWVAVQFVGGDLFGLMQNNLCFAVFGCNAGFFGYDAFVHLLAGAMFALFIVWIGEAYPRLKVVSENFWKSALIIISICALIETGWEIWEFGIDHFRMDVLRENLTNPNILWQPSNSDTMGDETFNLAGSVIAIILFT
jgi:hypothetical protein